MDSMVRRPNIRFQGRIRHSCHSTSHHSIRFHCTHTNNRSSSIRHLGSSSNLHIPYHVPPYNQPTRHLSCNRSSNNTLRRNNSNRRSTSIHRQNNNSSSLGIHHNIPCSNHPNS